MVKYCVWLSIDPVKRKLDFYPKNIALKIEKSYKERDPEKTSHCVLGSDFFNATLNFHPCGSKYQTTPGISVGRIGFKQPGYRSVKRIILDDDTRNVEVYSKQVNGEWRLAKSELESQIKFNETVPHNCKIEINEDDIVIEKTETWKPEDLHSISYDTNVVVWQWCRGTNKDQTNIFTLSSNWYIPYNYDITQIIENGFNTNNETIIDLPIIGKRKIEFINGTCFAKQISLDGKACRFMRRIITTIQELKIMFDNISNQDIDINELIETLPDGIIPHHFNCPILQDIMKDPVKTVDGHIYDRDAIETWFTHNKTSPLTGLPLQSIILEPHNELKKQINKFLISLKKNNVLEVDN